MQKTAQAWFTGGPTIFKDKSTKDTPSVLANWKAYSASKDSDYYASGFDIEAAALSTGGKVFGTFGMVSKGTRDLPGSFQYTTSSVTSTKSLMCFGLLLATGMFFVFIAFTMFLPVIVMMPQKFATCFTIGCALIILSSFALKGPKKQLAHMFSKERLPFTLGFVGTMVGTIYVSLVLHSYILSVVFSVLQVVALSYYAISYFPGGSAGLKFFSSSIVSSILSCFRR